MSMYDVTQPEPEVQYDAPDEKVVTARGIRVGDELVLEGGQIRTVESSTVNRAGRVSLAFVGQKTPKTFDPGEELVVIRAEETEASKQARKVHDREVNAHRLIMTFGSEKHYNEAVAALKSEDVPSLRLMERVLTAKLRWRLVSGAQSRFSDPDYEGDETSWVSLLERMVYRAADSLLSNHNSPSYSGGFSFSNAERQLQQEVTRTFVQDARWHAGVHALSAER